MYDELVKRLRNRRICIQQSGSLDDFPLLQQAADAIEELSKPRWIPVTERLPENDQDVLVMVHWRDYPENMMCYGRKYKTRWYLWNGELGELIKGFDITHWMPLPQPPKEE